MPQISVIVPVYKVEPYLRRCVDSILAQTFTDFELILVDDGSPDGCPAICDEYAEKDSRVVVIHQANGGLSAARNAGIDWVFANSDSKWITFVDSDDWIHINNLKWLWNANVEKKTAISMAQLLPTSDYVKDEIYEPSGINVKTSEDIWCSVPFHVSACCKLYSRDLWKGIRFPVGKLHEDTYTTYKVIFAAKTASLIAIPLYYCYNNPNSITRSLWNPKRLDVIDALSEQILYFYSHGYDNAYKSTCSEAIGYLCIMFSEIDSRKWPKEKKYLRSIILNYISKYKKLLGLSPISHPFFYETAYPTEMKVYWFLKAVKNKFGKLFGKGKSE